MNNIKMLYFSRIDVSEGIDVNRTSKSKEFNIFHYWYFLDKGFKFQLNASKGCYDLLMMSMNLSNNAILNIKSAGYCCIINKKWGHKLECKIPIWLKNVEHYKT